MSAALIVLMAMAAVTTPAVLVGNSVAGAAPATTAQGSATRGVQQGTTRTFFRTERASDLPPLLRNLSAVTDKDLESPPDGEWLSHHRGYELSGFSPLSQIHRGNVSDLELVWSVAMDGTRSQVQPLIHDGVMFLNQSSDIVQALDASNGQLLWSYDREFPDGLFRFAYANHNIAIYEDMIILATGDAHLVALDARTGQVRWDAEVADHADGYGYSAGPIVANGRIIAPMSGCYMINEGGCWISAHRPGNGSEVWRRTTIAMPDEPRGR